MLYFLSACVIYIRIGFNLYYIVLEIKGKPKI